MVHCLPMYRPLEFLHCDFSASFVSKRSTSFIVDMQYLSSFRISCGVPQCSVSLNIDHLWKGWETGDRLRGTGEAEHMITEELWVCGSCHPSVVELSSTARCQRKGKTSFKQCLNYRAKKI